MAKLNVVILAVEVMVGGVTYRKVDRKAQAGDVVKALKNGDDIDMGAFYAVYADSCGDAVFADNEGDERGDYQLRRNSENYEVYAPISEPISEPATATASDTITFEGATWRKVYRDVREGDAIKFTDDGRRSYLTEAELYVVNRVDSSDDPHITDDDGDEYDAGGDDYEVYEKVAEEKAQYREVNRKACEGERIKVVAIHPRSMKAGSVSVGEELTVKTVDSSGDIWSVEEREFRGIIAEGWEGVREYVVLEPVTKAADHPQPERLKVGEYARVVNVTFAMNNGMIGEIVEVTEFNAEDSAAPYEIRFVKSGDLRKSLPQHLVRATDEEVAVAKRAALISQFSVGDYVKLISGGGVYPRYGFSNGDVCTVDEPADSDGDFRVKRTEDGHRGYAQPEQLVKLTAEEVAEIERKQAEETKWNAIGRKVNEIKAGDVVQTYKAECGHPVGTVGIASCSGDASSISVEVAGKMTFYHFVKLIVPVEQRFDRAEEVDAA